MYIGIFRFYDYTVYDNFLQKTIIIDNSAFLYLLYTKHIDLYYLSLI